MANILIHPNSGIIEFSTGIAGGGQFNPNFTGGASAARMIYDNNGGLNFTSYVSTTSGLERFSIDGANGRLFSVTDNLSGSIFSVNDVAGLPIIEAFDDNTVIMGAFNRNDFIITGNSVGIGALPNTGTQKLFVSGLSTFVTTNEPFLNLNIVSSTVNFPLNSGMNFILPLTTNITGITFSNTPSDTYSFTLRVDYSGAHSIVWPTGASAKISWPSNVAPTLTSVSGKKDFFTFLTYNAGSEFFGFTSAQDF